MGKSVKEGIMPKQMIHNRYFGQFATDHSECAADHEAEHDCAGKKIPLDNSALKIGWTKDHNHVELAICDPTVEVFSEDPTAEGKVWHMQMDRSGINRAIRTLRQARDDAFGRDE